MADENKSKLILQGFAEMIARREIFRSRRLKGKTKKEIEELKIDLFKVACRALEEYDSRLQVLPGTYATLAVVERLNEIAGLTKDDRQGSETN